jgi:catechol 2,3-dioxygenase-like lactoylglutathione lyase family enzyme
MDIAYLHHAQVPYPPDQEAQARRFYAEVLGLCEMTRPAALANQPGMWFDLGHSQQLHLLAKDEGFGNPNHHFALMVLDLPATRIELRERGVATEDRPSFEEYGYDRCVLHDPFGNTIELVQQRAPH